MRSHASVAIQLAFRKMRQQKLYTIEVDVKSRLAPDRRDLLGRGISQPLAHGCKSKAGAPARYDRTLTGWTVSCYPILQIVL
jgi:hypothetical protein